MGASAGHRLKCSKPLTLAMEKIKVLSLFCIITVTVLGILYVIPRQITVEFERFAFIRGEPHVQVVPSTSPKSVASPSNPQSNASTASWHIVNVWTFSVMAIAPLTPAADLLRHLAQPDQTEKAETDKKACDDPNTFKPQVSEKGKKRRIHRLRKLLAMSYAKVAWKDGLWLLEFVSLAVGIRLSS